MLRMHARVREVRGREVQAVCYARSRASGTGCAHGEDDGKEDAVSAYRW